MTLSSIENSEPARRARDYWDRDGIPHLVAAGLYLVVVGVAGIGCFAWLHIDSLKQNWFFDSFVGPIAWLLVAISPFWIFAATTWLSINWEDVIEWFKTRITYPRTGYAAPPSYWEDDTVKRVELLRQRKRRRRRRGWFFNTLYVLCGFPLWLLLLKPDAFLGVMHSRRWLMLLLGVLVTIRAIRFAIYPEDTSPRDGQRLGAMRQAGRLLWSVLRSFWVLVFLIKLLHLSTGFSLAALHGPPLWSAVFLIIVVGSLPFSALIPRPGPVQVAGLCLCAIACALLVWRNLLLGTFITLLIPGLWATAVGSFRLYRYLRENPKQPV